MLFRRMWRSRRATAEYRIPRCQPHIDHIHPAAVQKGESYSQSSPSGALDTPFLYGLELPHFRSTLSRPKGRGARLPTRARGIGRTRISIYCGVHHMDLTEAIYGRRATRAYTAAPVPK